MLGLELEDSRAVAVRVDDQGVVQARAEADAGGGDLAAAALDALGQLAAPGAASDARVLGVAAVNLESPVLACVLATLAPRFGGPFADSGAVSSGTASAVAEAWTGAARGAQDVVFFGIGVHTTGGIVRGGNAVTGFRGRAASVWWLALNPVEREDYRKAGCLEAEASAAGIVRRMVWRIKAGDRSRVQEKVNDDLAAITIEHILEGARDRDGVSISVVRDTAKYLGMAAANLVVIADPEVLVLGGIMATAADLMLDPLRTEIARRLPKSMFDAVRIETAALGSDAAAIGAARLASAALP